MQTFTQTVASATTLKWNVPGNYFALITCSANCNVRLYLGGKKLDLGECTALLAGLEIGPLVPEHNLPFSFDRVEVDTSAADTITVGIGNGQAHYNRSNGSVNVTNYNGAAVNSQITVTNASVQIDAANAARRYLLIQNNDAAGDIYIRFDGAAVTTANGVKIKAGGYWESGPTWCPTGAVMAIGSIASNANCVMLEG
jgi:hypothetical protein